MSKIEILAPVGSEEMLRAAVFSGADAVYLGFSGFNARTGAGNFDADSLQEAVRFCHARGVAVHVALNTTVYGTELPALEQAEHLKKYANMWRITDDFWDEWRLLKGMFERAEKWCVHAAPGHWPDADMLPVGALRQCYDPNGWTNFTQAEQRTMMTLWCMMRSPLMMGGELTKNDDFTLKLLTNRDVLAIEKTSACAHPLWTTEDESAWVAPRRDGKGLYVALFNLSEETRTVRVTGEMLEGTYSEARELWTGEKQQMTDGLTATLGKHDAAVFWVE